MAGFDALATWPDLFEGLSADQKAAVQQVFATEYLSGWSPNRAAVEELIAFTRGQIDFDAYLSRATESAADLRSTN